jgi:hypothetical protein
MMLIGLKEILSYTRMSMTTYKRRNKVLKLPLLKSSKAKSGQVMATKEMLDNWMMSFFKLNSK